MYTILYIYIIGYTAGSSFNDLPSRKTTPPQWSMRGTHRIPPAPARSDQQNHRCLDCKQWELGASRG